MSIRRFFTKTISVYREADTTGNKRAFSLNGTVKGHFQDLDPELRQGLGIVGMRAWKFWFELNADVLVGDKLTDSDSNDYYVREVTKKDTGINQHLEVIATEKNA